MGLERRGCVVQPWSSANWKREEPVDEAKPFKATVEHREPCDSRASCTVLGAPGGESPPGDSTFASRRARPLHPSASELHPKPDMRSSCPFRREGRLLAPCPTLLTPVRLPLGRLRLVTSPASTGSTPT